MAESIEELTINYEEDGIQVVKELDKAVLSKGSWATILYRYQEWNRSKEQYGSEKYSIRRYRKTGGVYRQQGKFNISSVKQAQKLVEILQQWISQADGDSDSDSDSEE